MNKNAPTALRCEGITKTFDDGTGRLITVLNGAGFSVAPGEVLAIVGASGSGKSTLLHILGGLDVPDGGHVFIEDKDIGTLSDKQLGDMRNRELGFVYQFHHLLPEFTALENAAMPLMIRRTEKAEALRRAREALEVLGLGERLNHLPSQLSGGERQRCAIARSLAVKPTILLMDEPLASLDNARRREILPWLEKLRKELSIPILYVTHSEEEVERLADRVVMLSQGRKTTEGPVKDVFASRRTVGTLSAVVVEVDPDSSRMKIRLPEMGEKEIWIAATGAKPGDVLSLDLSAAGG